MALPVGPFPLLLCVAMSALTPRWGMAECGYDFAAALNIQILNRSTQMPIENGLNNWHGVVYVREGRLMDIEVWSYRVDLQFHDAGEGRYGVGVVLQERTSPSDVPPMPGAYNPDATYNQVNSTALRYEGTFGTPLIIRPDIGEVTLDLTLYPYPKETPLPVESTCTER